MEHFQRSKMMLDSDHWIGCAHNVRYLFPDVESFLEVGCGMAGLPTALKKAGLRSALGIDADPEIVAWNELKGLPVRQALAWALPLLDHSMDMLYSFHVLEHIPLDFLEKTLLEFDRVISKYICQTINFYSREACWADESFEAHIVRSAGHYINRDQSWWEWLMQRVLPNWEPFKPKAILAPWETEGKAVNIFLCRR